MNPNSRNLTNNFEFYIADGEIFSRNELKSRLNQMEIKFDTNVQKKNYYVDLYNNSVRQQVNMLKIADRLKVDTENRMKRTRDASEDTIRNDLNFLGKTGKIEESINASDQMMKNLINKTFERNDGFRFDKKSDERNAQGLTNSTQINYADFVPKNVNTIPSQKNLDKINENTTSKGLTNLDNKKVPVTTTKIYLKANDSINQNSNNKIYQVTTLGSTNNLEINNLNSQQNNFKKTNGINNPAISLNKSETQIKYQQVNTNEGNIHKFNSEPVNKANDIVDYRKNQFATNFTPLVFPDKRINNINIENNPKNYSDKDVPQEMGGASIYNETNKSRDIFRNLNYNNEIKSNNHLRIVTNNSAPSNNSISSPLNIKNTPPTKIKSIKSPNLQSQTNLPLITTENKEFLVVNPQHSEVFKQEIEQAKKISGSFSSQRSLKSLNQRPASNLRQNENINGGELTSNLGKIPVSSIKTNLLEDGIEKWALHPSSNGTSLRLLIKYFVAGLVCSVIFYGLLYCIQNSQSINLDELFMKNEVSNQNIPREGIKIMKDKINTKINDNIVHENISGFKEVPRISFSDKMKEIFTPFTNIYWAMTNPREFIWKMIVDGLKYVALELAWSYFKRNIWYFIGILILKYISYCAYRSFINKRNAYYIYRAVKTRLRSIYDVNNPFDGLTEEEIIREYSKEYKMKEDYFRSHILPLLKRMRRDDGEVREFETIIMGRNRIGWQYVGYI